jgi:c-di-GMP-related signal transduction protein
MRDPDLKVTGGRRKPNPPGDWIEMHPESAAHSLDPKRHHFLARQTILDQMGEIYGYELLSRFGSLNHFTGDPEAATRSMVDNWLLYGFEELAGALPYFLNCTREALVKGLVTRLPKSGTVLELLETIEPDKEVVSACRRLKLIGYGIALDDFQFSRKMEPLVELADYVKIDFRLHSTDRRKTLRQLEGSGVTLVAEKIETEEELKIAIEEGFELFQGYFFGRPSIFSRRKTPCGGDALPATVQRTGCIVV